MNLNEIFQLALKTAQAYKTAAADKKITVNEFKQILETVTSGVIEGLGIGDNTIVKL